MIQALIQRARFALKHRTLSAIIVLPRESESVPEQILVCHGGRLTAMPRRCPHQGAPLEQGYFKGGNLLCPWHGCKFKLSGGVELHRSVWQELSHLASKLAKVLSFIAIPVALVIAFRVLEHNHARYDEGFYIDQTQRAYLTIRDVGWIRGLLDIYFHQRGFRPILHPVLGIPFFFLTGGRAELSISLYVISLYALYTYFAYRFFSAYLKNVELFLATSMLGLCPVFIGFSNGYNATLPLLTTFMGFICYLKWSNLFKNPFESALSGVFLGLAVCFRPVDAILASSFIGMGYFAQARKFSHVSSRDGILFLSVIGLGFLILCSQFHFGYESDRNWPYLFVAVIPWIPLCLRKRLKLTEGFWWFAGPAYSISVLWFAVVIWPLYSWALGSSFGKFAEVTGHRNGVTHLKFLMDLARFFVWPILALLLLLSLTRLQEARKNARFWLLLVPAVIVPGMIGSLTFNSEYYYYLPSALIAYLGATVLVLSPGGAWRWTRVTLVSCLVCALVLYRIGLMTGKGSANRVREYLEVPGFVPPAAKDPLDEIYRDFTSHLPTSVPIPKKEYVSCVLQMRYRGAVWSGLDWVVDPSAMAVMAREQEKPWTFVTPYPYVRNTTAERFQYVKDYCDFVFVLPIEHQYAPVEHFMSDVGEIVLSAWKEGKLKSAGLTLEGRGTYADWSGTGAEYLIFRPIHPGTPQK